MSLDLSSFLHPVKLGEIDRQLQTDVIATLEDLGVETRAPLSDDKQSRTTTTITRPRRLDHRTKLRRHAAPRAHG